MRGKECPMKKVDSKIEPRVVRTQYFNVSPDAYIAEKIFKALLLIKESKIAQKRLEELYASTENSQITWRKFDSDELLRDRNDFPEKSFNKDVPEIHGKTISYEVILNVIGRRFHSCLK